MDIANKFENLMSFYEEVFDENDNVPAVGKIIVKPEAIAKSHKPEDLCRCCPIIGTEDLNEIYIKVNKQSLQKNNGISERSAIKKIQGQYDSGFGHSTSQSK